MLLSFFFFQILSVEFKIRVFEISVFIIQLPEITRNFTKASLYGAEIQNFQPSSTSFP